MKWRPAADGGRMEWVPGHFLCRLPIKRNGRRRFSGRRLNGAGPAGCCRLLNEAEKAKSGRTSGPLFAFYNGKLIVMFLAANPNRSYSRIAWRFSTYALRRISEQSSCLICSIASSIKRLAMDCPLDSGRTKSS